MTFAAFSTVVAVFENIVALLMDMFGMSRQKSTLINVIAMTVLSMPCVLGFNMLSGVQLLGEESTILDFEDFVVSNNLLPLGCLTYVLFITRKNGWGWDNFMAEANAGEGTKFSEALKGFVSYVIPLIILIVYFKGYYDFFNVETRRHMLIPWMCAAVVFMLFILYNALRPAKKK